MKEKRSIHKHKVHRSLIEPAEMSGVKLKWFGFLCLFILVLLPMTGNTLVGYGVLALLVWGIHSYVLTPLYRWDKWAFLMILQGLIQKPYHTSGDDVIGPPKPSPNSIPKIK